MRLLVAVLVSTVGLAVAQPALAEGGFDPGRAAQSLCSTPVGLKLGADCVSRLTGLLAACKAKAPTPDAFKACATAQLPTLTTAAPRRSDFDVARVAQYLCKSPLGAKLGDGCVARLTALVTSCKGQSPAGDTWKSCVMAQLRPVAGDTKRKQR